MTDINRAFGKQMFLTARNDLRNKMGSATANKLLKNNMDVCGHPTRGYHIAWLPCEEVGLDKDLWQHRWASCINEARAYAIIALLEYLYPEED